MGLRRKAPARELLFRVWKWPESDASLPRARISNGNARRMNSRARCARMPASNEIYTALYAAVGPFFLSLTARRINAHKFSEQLAK